MKKELTFVTTAIAPDEVLQHHLDDFETRYNIHVNLQSIPWKDYRQELTNIALHHLPCDVSSAGAPVTSDLIAMNALRPFTAGEIAMLGGEAAYLPSRWRSGIRPRSTDMWAFPWLVDYRLLYYRKDLIAKAGLDEQHAFASPQALEQTLQIIKDRGVASPWYGISASVIYGVLHRIASWIWAYGGDLFTPDGKQVIFHEKEALEGIRAYFRLLQYLPGKLPEDYGRALLFEGKTAAIIENGFAMYNGFPPEIGCVAVPGGSYVGGVDLMIWSHSRNDSAAFELVRFLSSPEVATQISPASFYVPAQLKSIELLTAQSQPYGSRIYQAICGGRAFPCVPMVGLLEERLSTALLSIQQEILANPSTDLEKLLQQRVVSLGKRTNISLGGIA